MNAFRYAIVGSGSKANAYIFETADFSFVIDNGFTLKEFKKRLADNGFHYSRVQGVWLTHNHGDHIRGLEALLVDRKVPVLHHHQTNLKGFLRHPSITGIPVAPGKSSRFGQADFYPFPLYHDAPHALGYHFKVGGVTFTLITDTGRTDDLMLKLAARSQVLFLEANYCPDLLETGPYPRILKNRVASDTGHLSNHQAIQFLNKLHDMPEGTRLEQVYLVHLSENNNTVETVQNHVQEHLRWRGRLEVCPRYEFIEGWVPPS